jgi:hypothetical protein
LQQAEDAARDGDLPVLLAGVYNCKACFHHKRGNYEAALPLLREVRLSRCHHLATGAGGDNGTGKM